MDGKYLQTSWTALPKLFSKITQLEVFLSKGYKLKKSSSLALMTHFELDSRNAGFLKIHLTRRQFGMRRKTCLGFFKVSLYTQTRVLWHLTRQNPAIGMWWGSCPATHLCSFSQLHVYARPRVLPGWHQISCVSEQSSLSLKLSVVHTLSCKGTLLPEEVLRRGSPTFSDRGWEELLPENCLNV